MRHPSCSRRAASALLWIWFAVFLAAPASWRPCPMHRPVRQNGVAGSGTHAGAHERADAGTHMAATAHDVDADTHMAATAHDADAGTHMAAAAHDADAGEDAPAHPCDCATDCCGTSPTAIEPPSILAAPHAIPARNAPVFASTIGVAAARVRLLPFANAPPAA